MARFWCKQCEIFIDDNKIARRHHEDSERHKRSIFRSINKVHQKNREEKRNEAEYRKARKDPKIIKNSADKVPKIEDPKPSTDNTTKEDDDQVDTVIGGWETITNDSASSDPIVWKKSEVPEPTILRKLGVKKQSVADTETKNWNLSSLKKPVYDDISDSEDIPKVHITSFKKRRVTKQ